MSRGRAIRRGVRGAAAFEGGARAARADEARAHDTDEVTEAPTAQKAKRTR